MVADLLPRVATTFLGALGTRAGVGVVVGVDEGVGVTLAVRLGVGVDVGFVEELKLIDPTPVAVVPDDQPEYIEKTYRLHL